MSENKAPVIGKSFLGKLFEGFRYRWSHPTLIIHNIVTTYTTGAHT